MKKVRPVPSREHDITEAFTMVSICPDGTIEFAFFRPSAHKVAVAGDFNNWDTQRQELRPDEHGWWHLRMAIEPGEYKFKYVIDDSVWEADFAAYGVEMCKIGGWTSVLYVPEQAARFSESMAA